MPASRIKAALTMRKDGWLSCNSRGADVRLLQRRRMSKAAQRKQVEDFPECGPFASALAVALPIPMCPFFNRPESHILSCAQTAARLREVTVFQPKNPRPTPPDALYCAVIRTPCEIEHGVYECPDRRLIIAPRRRGWLDPTGKRSTGHAFSRDVALSPGQRAALFQPRISDARDFCGSDEYLLNLQAAVNVAHVPAMLQQHGLGSSYVWLNMRIVHGFFHWLDPVPQLFSLRRLYDTLAAHICGLESLGTKLHTYGAMLLPVVQRAMPRDILLDFGRKCATDANSTFDDQRSSSSEGPEPTTPEGDREFGLKAALEGDS
ncbi:hypothetical protein MTO96_028309 [Rhipicephalus appendiculatus]